MPFAKTLLFISSLSFLLLHCHNTATKQEAPSDTSKALSFDLPNTKTQTYPGKEFETRLREHAEKTAKKKYYTPRIAIYKKMLVTEPDNPTLKKRLGLAYFHIEEYEQALPLLEGLRNQGIADQEVLEIIKKIKQQK